MYQLASFMQAPLRLCLDLNVWCAAFLADKAGRSNTSTQRLISAVRSGTSPIGVIQLVISWGMLNRLRKVFVADWGIDTETTDEMIQAIVGYVRLGAAGMEPQLTLGGTGLLPLRDNEDAHVLNTAVAGLSDILVTTNMSDFLPRHIEVFTPGLLAQFSHPKKTVLIAHPFTVREWFDAGKITDNNLFDSVRIFPYNAVSLIDSSKDLWKRPSPSRGKSPCPKQCGTPCI